MPKIYMGYDNLGSTSTGLGTTHSGGGTIQEFAAPGDITTGAAASNTATSLDFSNGITFNSDTGQWIAGVLNDGFYVYNSLADMQANNFAQKIPYTGGWNFNNGIAYKADTNTYVVAFFASNRISLLEFNSLQDAAALTNQVGPTRTGAAGVNFTNGIEYDAKTGKWYGAFNTGQGGLAEFNSLSDLLAFQNPTLYPYVVSQADFEMGVAIVCFGRGSLIETEKGPIAVENLSAGDLVRTRDHGYQPVRWVGSRKLTRHDLAKTPALRPVRISAGALGSGVPAQDLIVSPQHRVLICSGIAQNMFGGKEVLVAARQLLEVDGIDVAEDVENVEYFHILFDRHQIVYSNGAPTESLYPGKQALKSVDAAAREEIFQLFPELAEEDESYVAEAARTLIPGRLGRKLVERHVKNNKALFVE